jgi:outer membrane protein assembly factor BamB
MNSIRILLQSRLLGLALLLAMALAVPMVSGPLALAQADFSAVRIMSVDARTGELNVLDAATGEVVGTFTTPAGGFISVYPSSSGKYLLANHYFGQHVTIVDSGLRSVPHGDHVDLIEGAPFVRATIGTPGGSGHFWTEGDLIFVYNDTDGSVTVLDESELEGSFEPVTFSAGDPDHASIAVLNDTLLIGFGGRGQVDAYSFDGSLVQEAIGDCPGPHGEARTGEVVAFACEDGILLITQEGDQFVGELLAYPAAQVTSGTAAATPQATEADSVRSSLLAWHGEANLIVGNYGDGLLLIDPIGKELSTVSLSASALWMTFDRQGDRLIALTDDGRVHSVAGADGSIEWTTEAATAYSSFPQEDAIAYYPFIAVSDRSVYVPNPTAGTIVEVRLANGEITNQFDVDGEPARVTLVIASGVRH